MPKVDLPLPAATATIDAKIVDANGNPPPNVIRENDDAAVVAELILDGVMFDAASLGWEFLLRIEGNPKAPNTAGDNFVLGPTTVLHNGTPGGAPYTLNATIPIPQATLRVPPGEKAQSYEFTLEVLGVDDNTGNPHGMAGFVDLSEVMVFAGP